MQDRRGSMRQRTMLAGVIEIADRSTLDCRIINLSEHGAAIEIDQAFCLPEKATLVIARGARRRIDVKWRGYRTAGVHLHAPERARTSPTSAKMPHDPGY